MKRYIIIILILVLGFAKVSSATTTTSLPLDSLSQEQTALPADKATELYRTLLNKQDSEEKAFYNNLITQLGNTFQAKAMQRHNSKTFILIYGILLIALAIIFPFTCYYIWNAHRLYLTQHRNQLQIKKLLATTENINASKAAFLQDINFRIRTPLNCVVGLSDILCNHPEWINREDLVSVSESIKNNSQALQRLVNSILDLSRLEAGMMKFSLSEHFFSLIFQDAIAIVKLNADREHPTHIELDNQLSVGEDVIYVDSSRLTLIVADMLGSSTGATSDKIHVRLSICEDNPHMLSAVINNSPMAGEVNEDSLSFINQRIAKLFFDHFGGSFTVKGHNILLTFPLK